MNVEALEALLAQLAGGQADVPTVLARLRQLPFESTDTATIDHHRALRCGAAEVIFAAGKTADEVVDIARRLAHTDATVLATRCSDEQLVAMQHAFGPSCEVGRRARCALINVREAPTDSAMVSVVCAGTSDLHAADEAAMTLRAMRVRHRKIVDVGVAGVHRLLARLPELQDSCAIVAIAGMEGALPTAVGGLVSCPVFAVPTSIGYGTSLGGLAALLGMMSSCASNVSVVNIDNGFGAACCAAAVARQAVVR